MGQPIIISKSVILRLVRDNPLYWNEGRAVGGLESVLLQRYPVVMIGSVPSELDAWLAGLEPRWLDLLHKWRVVTTVECWEAQLRTLDPVTIDHIRPVVTPDIPTAYELVASALGPDHDLTVRLGMYLYGTPQPDHDPMTR